MPEREALWTLGIPTYRGRDLNGAYFYDVRIYGPSPAPPSTVVNVSWLNSAEQERDEALTKLHRRGGVANLQARVRELEAQLTEAIREREEAERKLAAATDNGVRLSNFYRGGGER